MILENKTKQKYGYSSDELTAKSSKPVIVICDYCKEEHEKIMKSVTLGRSIIEKDACIKCKFIKREEVSLKKHGVKNSAQRKEVRKKIGASNEKRLKSDAFKEQAKKTNLKKYGCCHPMGNKKVRDKIEKTVLEKYGVKNISKLKEFRDKATVKTLETKIKNGSIVLYNGKTRPQLAKEIGFSRNHFGKLVNKYGIDKAINMEPKKSELEFVFQTYLEDNDISYETQVRIKKPNSNHYIADFKIDNLLIELDGLYWHSDKIIEDNNYHADKKALYDQKGYRSLFFREDEVYNKFEIVKSIVNYHLGKTYKVGARKCEIVELDTKAANNFFEENHLMGKGAGRTFALSYNNIFSSALRVKRVSGDNYEISRFCNSLGCSITGGFSKLLKHTERNIKMKTLKTFIDRRYGSGDYLSSMGFSYKSCYPSFAWTDGEQRFHRMKFSGNSGYELGLSKIWDCGQAKWIKEY